jgi:hypothetical protein
MVVPLGLHVQWKKRHYQIPNDLVIISGEEQTPVFFSKFCFECPVWV